MDNGSGNKLVCVVGAGGYLGASLVKALLSKGYTVHATVRDPSKVQFLTALPCADDLLKLFAADLLQEGSFDAAIAGCRGVFLVAFPLVTQPQDPEKEEIEVALKGAMNVLSSCDRSQTVKRVVYTSSVRAALHREDETRRGEIFVDESRWSDVDWLRQLKQSGWGYRVAKTLGEKAALEFGEDRGMQVVSVLPAMVGGPWLGTVKPWTVTVIKSVFTGHSLGFSRLQPAPGFVHVDDVAEAHVFLIECPRAHGRYICCADSPSLSEFIELVRFSHPEKYHKEICSKYLEKVSVNGETAYRISNKKLISLGFSYKHDLVEILNESEDEV